MNPDRAYVAAVRLTVRQVAAPDSARVAELPRHRVFGEFALQRTAMNAEQASSF